MKRTLQKIAPGTLPSAVIVFLMLLSAVGAAALPVIGELDIVAGTRGVAVSLSADAPFGAVFSGNNKTVTTHLTGCVYGLSEFSYTDFPASSPLRSITAAEKTAGNITITFILKQTVTLPVKAIQKKNQWMALLCENPVEPYTWNAPGSSPVPAPGAKAPSTPPEKTTPQTGFLRNIRLLQRGQICELAFEFDTEVTSAIQKKGTLITFTTENIKNSLGTALLNLPDNSVFKKVALREINPGNAPLLTAAITIDTALAESNFNVAFTRGTVLSIFIMERKQQKATLWTSGHGLAWSYQFYDVPSYNIDMESIGSKARRDALQQLSREKTFAIKETAPPKALASAPKQPASDTLPVPSPVEATAVSAPEETTDTMTVAVKKANIRGTPSLKGAIKGSLGIGDTVYVVSTTNKWHKIRAKGYSGFIYSALVHPVDREPARPPTTVIANLQETAPVATPENPPPTMTKVSTTISDNVYPQTPAVPVSSPLAPPVNTDADAKFKNGIRYNRGGRRDPFEPIIPSSVSLSGLPFPENLRLVGVLYDDVDRIALCEDTQNDYRPFALREHDPVEKGKLLKIYRDKAVFLITEFGISRSFTLQLSKVTDEQEASQK